MRREYIASAAPKRHSFSDLESFHISRKCEWRKYEYLFGKHSSDFFFLSDHLDIIKIKSVRSGDHLNITHSEG